MTTQETVHKKRHSAYYREQQEMNTEKRPHTTSTNPQSDQIVHTTATHPAEQDKFIGKS